MAGSFSRPVKFHRRPPSPWTDERIEYLKARWSQGVPAGRIARELGHGVSRSAVLGKIHRLGIAELSPYAGGCGQRPKEARRPPNHAHAHGVSGKHSYRQKPLPAWVTDATPYIDDPLVDTDIPPPQRRSFLELTSHTCRWPIGDPSNSDFFFCGAEPSQHKPYCAAHCARAYRPRQQMPRRAPSARRRRAMLKYRGIATYIKLGGETVAEWAGEEA
jgi:GcrA cell cycle regulator